MDSPYSYSNQFRALANFLILQSSSCLPLFPTGTISTAHQYHSIVEATMAQLPQRDIRTFWRADHPPRQVLVFKGVQVLCSNCQKPFMRQGITSHLERFSGSSKQKAVPQGRVKVTGPLYAAAEKRLAAEAEEKRNTKRFKAWAEGTLDSAYSMTPTKATTKTQNRMSQGNAPKDGKIPFHRPHLLQKFRHVP
jgi:hypothetical protein